MTITIQYYNTPVVKRCVDTLRLTETCLLSDTHDKVYLTIKPGTIVKVLGTFDYRDTNYILEINGTVYVSPHWNMHINNNKCLIDCTDISESECIDKSYFILMNFRLSLFDGSDFWIYKDSVLKVVKRYIWDRSYKPNNIPCKIAYKNKKIDCFIDIDRLVDIGTMIEL